MKALDRKLVRDLWAQRSQALAIAAVIGSGITLLVMSVGTFGSLSLTQETYYRQFGFADVFANTKRAPSWLEAPIAEIPGVRIAETRVVVDVTLDVPGMEEPARGRLVSLPDRGEPRLNGLFLRRGRWVERTRPDEVLLSEGFAKAHDLEPGDRLAAIINGRRKELDIVGIALSPEYVYTISAGDLFPDARRFGIVWMSRQPLAAAFDMEGGFNDVSVSLAPGVSEAAVIADLDRLLEPYGGLGAIPRALQVSHWYLANELRQLRSMGMMIPLIFMSVATFLLNVVLSRTVSVQREQIAALKALGYSNGAIGVHYTKWAIAVAAIGAVIGMVAGTWLSTAMLRMYLDYFAFPILEYQWSWSTFLGAVAISMAAASLGALGAVRIAVRLPPAEAMRPAPPARYRVSWIERIGFAGWLQPASRMIVRNVQRRPVRTTLSIVGIAFAGAIMVVGGAFLDSIDELLEVQFNVVQRQDVTVTFTEPASSSSYYELTRMPGVIAVEPMRAVPVRLRHAQRSRQLAVLGYPEGARLTRVVGADYRPVTLPAEGLVMSQKLADILEVERGQQIEVEVLEGARPVRRVVVTDLVDDYLGTSAYMRIDALQRLMREGSSLSGASLQVDPDRAQELYRLLKETPSIAGVGLRRAMIDNFNTYLADNIGMMMGFFLFFAFVIAFGVVYNTSRISLSERARELASLRVMGFTRGEISYILLGELAILTLVALPLGLVLGYGLVGASMQAMDTELYRFPLMVAPSTFLMSLVTVAGSTMISAIIVRRKLDHLDLVGVLKTRE